MDRLSDVVSDGGEASGDVEAYHTVSVVSGFRAEHLPQFLYVLGKYRDCGLDLGAEAVNVCLSICEGGDRHVKPSVRVHYGVDAFPAFIALLGTAIYPRGREQSSHLCLQVAGIADVTADRLLGRPAFLSFLLCHPAVGSVKVRDLGLNVSKRAASRYYLWLCLHRQ
jgi:hypothetical protein